MKNIIILSILLVPLISFGQKKHLSIFENLVGKTWKAEGHWENGSRFSQEVKFNYSLNGKLVIAESVGFIDEAQTEFGQRNHGIRRYNKKSNIIEFFEFDVFGGLTTGKVTNDGKNIIYQYDYGGSQVTDMWEYVNDSTYNFKVGKYENGQLSQIYLSTRFKEIRKLDVTDVLTMAKDNLAGNWSSPAWDGQLNESWSIDNHGQLIQSAEYSENDKVLFQSNNKMEIVNNELILFSVIKDSNPKIFKATSWSDNSITFENSDYKNPNKVIYYFISSDEFHRTISGLENNEFTEYTFNFKLQE